MIRPLEWQGLLVPILPAHMKEVLNAPVPYICGVTDLSSFEVSKLNKNEAMIVHLDVDAIRMPFSHFPELPESHRLRTPLKRLHNFVYNSKDTIDSPYFGNYEYASTSDEIFSCFLNYT